MQYDNLTPAVRIIQIFPDRIDDLCVDAEEGDILSPSSDVLVIGCRDETQTGGCVAHPAIVGELVRLPLKQGGPLQLKRALGVFICEHGGALLLSKQEPFAAVPAAKAHALAKRLEVLDFRCEAEWLRNAAKALGRNAKAQPHSIAAIKEGDGVIVKDENGKVLMWLAGVTEISGGVSSEEVLDPNRPPKAVPPL